MKQGDGNMELNPEKIKGILEKEQLLYLATTNNKYVPSTYAPSAVLTDVIILSLLS